VSNRRTRDHLTAERKRQAAADRRKRGIWIAVGVSVLVVALVVVFAVVQNSRTSTDVVDAALPALVDEQGGGMVFGDGATTLDVWLDFQCPNCKEFEAAYGEAISDAVANGDITLVIHSLSFLDEPLQNDSSSLAANAFGCSASAGEDKSLAFQQVVFDNQPAERVGVAAWSNEDLVTWGDEAGISGDEWQECVDDNAFAGWVEQVAASQVDAGVTGTPSVFVDGEAFSLEQDLTPVLAGTGQ